MMKPVIKWSGSKRSQHQKSNLFFRRHLEHIMSRLSVEGQCYML